MGDRLVQGLALQEERRIAGLAARRKAKQPAPKPTGDAETDAWVPPEGAVPFGPFLALGAAEYLFFGEQLVGWYLSLLQGIR